MKKMVVALVTLSLFLLVKPAALNLTIHGNFTLNFVVSERTQTTNQASPRSVALRGKSKIKH
jgi:hypothetical protein